MKNTAGLRVRWKGIGMLVLLAFFCAGTGEGAAWNISGPWLVEGTGYVDWKGIRSSLELDGNMTIYTVESGDIWAITSYDLTLELDATVAGIGVWDDHLQEVFHDHIPLLESLNPSLGDPFRLPAVTTKDGLTYRITFTSETSGTVDISGEDSRLGSVSGLKIGSESALWKSGTPKPGVNDASSGCNAGKKGLFSLAAAALLMIYRVFRGVRVK
ncbi:MAG: hypothetical protein K5841_02685 [Fretibacterium sp.]|nr:hypothetical protein [Fretibacterium sp.]